MATTPVRDAKRDARRTPGRAARAPVAAHRVHLGGKASSGGATYTVSEMIKPSSRAAITDDAELIRAIETCLVCAHACVSCADACVGENDPRPLLRCIRLDLDCADISQATWRLLARQLEPELDVLALQLELCARACVKCAEECERHAGEHDHCRVCAETCRWCERACRALLAKVPAQA